MKLDYKKAVTEAIARQDYDTIVTLGREQSAKTLRCVQMNLWGDDRTEQRWNALMALGVLAKTFAPQQDEVYRNVIRRAVWAMADESGNVPWAAPEMMTVVIKACPQQYREFISIMITNGLDSPMCHKGVLWSIGYLGAEYIEDIEPFFKRILKLLQSKDTNVRGMAVWALKKLCYTSVFDKMNPRAEDTADVWIYEKGALQKTTVQELLKL